MHLAFGEGFGERLQFFYLAALKNFFMEYSKLVSVTGLPGLFELVASKNDGAIVRTPWMIKALGLFHPVSIIFLTWKQ